MDKWVEAKDPKSGKTYYFNKATKTTQWTKPESMGGEPAKPKEAAPAAAAGGDDDAATNPANWKEGTDPKSGKTYFYNKKTKQTTWKKPACMGGGEAAAKPAAVEKPAEEKPAAAAAAPAAASSGGDWREATDPKSGKKYWYNKVTKKTTWKDPHASADAPAAEVKAEPARRMSVKKTLVESSDDESDEDERPATAASVNVTVGKNQDDEEDQQMKLKQAMNDADEEDGEDGDNGDDGESTEFKFAKHRKGWFNRTFRTGEVHDDKEVMTFKKSLIKKALLKQNRDLDEEAVQSFKNVMSYMGDRKSSKLPLDHAKKMLKNLMSQPSTLRDEVYMQLCKQTTDNPRVASTIKGWELMVFCIATFPPSKLLKGFLQDFIKKAIKDNQQEQVTALAEVCLKHLPKILLMGQRMQVPSKLEMSCLIEVKPVPIRVLLCNGSFKTFMVDSYTLIKEVEEMLVQKYNLTFFQPFAIFEQADANEERILDPKDRILDAMASWENRPTLAELQMIAQQQKGPKSSRNTKFDKHKDMDKKVEVRQVEYRNYLYKAKLVLKTSNKEIMADPEAVNMIYIQAVADVVTNRYPSNEKDITVLAALQLQATYGDFKKDVHVPGWLAPKITEFIPKHLIVKKTAPDKVQDNLVKEWEVKILAKYQKVADFSSMDAKLNYLDYVQEWNFYGASFFSVEQRQFKDYPSPLTLGINCEGVLLMHPEKKTVLENYQFTEIVTWGHSDEKFIVVVGNIVQQRKLIFKTDQGKNMNHLIHDYVKHKVKNKA